MLFYILTIAGLFRLRFTRPNAERPYRAFGYPIVPALYIVGAICIGRGAAAVSADDDVAGVCDCPAGRSGILPMVVPGEGREKWQPHRVPRTTKRPKFWLNRRSCAEVRIRGYKSIAFCDVTLEPLTILVGRNASGKSNFLDALAFLRDVLDQGANSAIEEHGGAAVFSEETKTGRLEFEIDSTFPSYQMQCRASYRVKLALSARKQLGIQEEVLQLEDQTNGITCGFTAAQGHVTWQGLDSFGEGRLRRGLIKEDAVNGGPPRYAMLYDTSGSERPYLGVIGSQPFLDLAEGLRSIGCFAFHPEAIRKPQPRVGSPALKRNGRNLARAIEGLKEIEQRDLDRVKAYLRAIVPEIEGFEVFPLGDFETLRFQVRSRLESSPLNLYAASMSDGTLRALAALVAAFRNSPANRSCSHRHRRARNRTSPGGHASVGGRTGRSHLAHADHHHDALSGPTRRGRGQTRKCPHSGMAGWIDGDHPIGRRQRQHHSRRP